ncbi:hypothetical protein B0J13DRAFT_673863 [Dactylonectria estremocensis]|uniref:Protein bir1 n=1 Tax=Dactylonectria estremocensis TaxID=1079267 RepID=A0A9P9F1L8_9HYPO|nr:hypothetical protein B0J13DRAFT_673863 [Dactylonectria estremocensis]
MSAEDITDEYITYESRLASFHRSVKKRASGANGRGTKNLTWPHRNIAPASLAHAGFFYNPSPANPDNATCFLCHKGLDGWEAGDDPLLEHLKHSPDCGWAIVAAIEAELGDHAKEDPSQPYMKEARKATFAGRWPHDSKKAWKCKTKQLVDAGWKYTPTSDSDDMATCVYCQLALDGWEPADKPLDEHYNRSPDCPFFTLLEQTQGAKKASRSKAGRASKASRLSVQSVATVTSEAPSANESMALEDSVLTTASTQGGKKSKARKTATGKGRKTKAKKEEPVEEREAEIEEEAPASPKPTRGKKRASTAMDDSIMTAAEAPAPKKRATAKRTEDSSVLEPADDTEMMDAPAPKKTGPRKGQASATRPREASTASETSVASAASVESIPGAFPDFPDDDEIERQLEADLERPLSEEDEITLDSDSERMKQSKGSRSSKTEVELVQQSTDYAMFNPTFADPDEDEVEDELRALEAEMEVKEVYVEEVHVEEVVEEPEVEEPQVEERQPSPEPQELNIPKKGRKAGTRKASKQTKAKKVKATPEHIEKEVEEEKAVPELRQETEEVEEQVHEDSLASTGTVVKNSAAARLSTGKRGRGRPSKASLASRESTGAVDFIQPSVDSSVHTLAEPVAEPPAKRGRGRPSKASLASRASLDGDASQHTEPAPKRGRGRPPKKSLEARQSLELAESQKPPEAEAVKEDVETPSAQRVEMARAPVVSFEEPQSFPIAQSLASSPPRSTRHLANPPSTPGRVISPAPSARQAAISPSQSPQSSDAENQPPSSKPAASAKRVALAPVPATPSRASPSKRNMIAGLRSTAPWTELDVEALLGSPLPHGDKENSADQLLKQGKALTSPEKQMTVEEWILHNAGEAEKKLKQECEAMVSRFESEGSKAMHVLEGLVVE